MQVLRSARLMLLALVVALVPAAAHAGVFISVGFAPPVLPVYVQPVCPEPGLMWTPGYWAYGDEGYYWVPGAWVPAPYSGALWTPSYWGWEGGHYLFHDGYWGPHVGYYGGVNYGFGYGGIGFAGGMWRGGIFAYNTAVLRVGVGGGWGSRVYVDHAIVERGYVARDSHVAYSGGPGGIHHEAGPEERIAEHEQHRGPSDVQQHHFEAARADRTSYVKNNGGHPSNLAVSRPMSVSHTTTTTHTSSTTTRTTTNATHTASMGNTHTAASMGSHGPTNSESARGVSGGSSHTNTPSVSHTASTRPSTASAPRSSSGGAAGGSHGGGSAPKGGGGGGGHHK